MQGMKIDQPHDQTGPSFRKFPVGGNLSEVIKRTAPLRNLVLLNQISVLNFHFFLEIFCFGNTNSGQNKEMGEVYAVHPGGF